MLNLTRIIDNIKVRIHGVKLYIHEIKNVSALESRIRTIYELEGIVKGFDEEIKVLQAQIILACGNPEEIKRLMGFLKKDSHRVDFLQAYIAGGKVILQMKNDKQALKTILENCCVHLKIQSFPYGFRSATLQLFH